MKKFKFLMEHFERTVIKNPYKRIHAKQKQKNVA